MSLMIASSAAALAMALQATPQVHYVLSIEEAADQRPVVSVEIRFDGEMDGSTDLHLPDEWGGQNELWNGVTGLEVDGASIAQGELENVRILTHSPGAELVVRYQIIQDWDGVPNAEQSNYRPILQPGYLHMIGNTWVAEPDLGEDKQVSVAFETQDGWNISSDLQHGITDMDGLMSSVLVAGDFRIETRQVDDAEIRLAIRGEGWPLSDEAFADTVQDVVAASHYYWGTPGEDYFVSLLPVEAPADWQSLGGTNLGDSFAFFATRDFENSTLIEILTHEHSHTWMPLRLGGMVDGLEQAAGYWLSEGFNDFLTQRIGVAGELWTPEQSVTSWNSQLMDYWTSPVKDAPNAMIETGFWTDRNIQRLPYMRGMIFAALVEDRIREATDGERDLDDVLNHMLNTAEDVLAPDAFLPAVEAVSGADLSADFQRHIIEGQPIALPADAFGACGEVVTSAQPVFEYGLSWGDRDDEGRRNLDAVEPGTNAEAAGFLVGMKLIERVGGAYGDATQETVFRVEHEGEVMDIAYWPTNGETFPLQQIVVADDVDWAACARVIAGE